jgi:hypothetical protein
VTDQGAEDSAGAPEAEAPREGNPRSTLDIVPLATENPASPCWGLIRPVESAPRSRSAPVRPPAHSIMLRTIPPQNEPARRAPRTRSLLHSALAGAALLTLGTGCQSAAPDIDDHWNFKSVPPRMARHILGYDAARDGMYRDFQWERKKDINLTLRRLILNNNPENPFQDYDPSLYEGRPVHSILPDPVMYIHLEGLFVGWALTAASSGAFIPIPIDSLIGTFEDGGGEEFWRGIEASFTGEGVLTASQTPAMYAEEIDASQGDVTTLTRM